MTPGARIAATIELLDAIGSEQSPPDQVLDGYFRRRRFAGSGDRRDIGARVYDILRWRARLDWWIARTGLPIEPSVRARVIAHLILLDRASPEELTDLFSGAKHCAQPLSDCERQLADALYGRAAVHEEMPDHVRFEYPEWMDRSFRAIWGDRLEDEMSALNQQAPLDLRVNMIKTTPEKALARLREDYLECEPTTLSPIGIRVAGKVRLGGTRAFKEGLVEVQDEGSQLVSLLAGAKPGMTVVDYCAGAGGKTLALAADMAEEGKVIGRVHALDVSKYRLDRMAPRLKRAGCNRVSPKVIVPDGDPWVAGNARAAERVIADVPCTHTGSWRRNPEDRWRFSLEDLDAIKQTQQQILVQAASLVKIGGRLIYVTCSLLQEENEQQLLWFLEHNPDFRALPIDEVWRETVGGPPPPAGPALRLSPASTGTDGFFCAVLERMDP